MRSDITVRDLASMAIEYGHRNTEQYLMVRLRKLSIQSMRIGKLITSKLKMAYLL